MIITARRASRLRALLAAGTVALAAGCTAAAEPPARSGGAPTGAAGALATLAVKGRAPLTGYGRDAFGQAWADTDRNGCDTRNDILRRDLADAVLQPGTAGCVVLAGTLHDPYGGRTIRFVRGAGAVGVEVDHVVALANAWQTGARGWDAGRRTAFANDPLGLLAVDGTLNRGKGAGDAATWLPPSRGYRCAYVARQVAVKTAYGLWVTPAERAAMARVLGTCPGQPLPAPAAPAPASVVSGATPRPAAPAPSPATAPAAGGATDPRFRTCRAAADAGYGPYREGTDAEYGWYADRDRDGIVCE